MEIHPTFFLFYTWIVTYETTATLISTEERTSLSKNNDRKVSWSWTSYQLWFYLSTRESDSIRNSWRKQMSGQKGQCGSAKEIT